MKRKTPLKRKPPKKGDEAYRTWIRMQSCIVNPFVCHGPMDPAHVKSRGAGGKDRENLVPLCRKHHREQHDIGIKSFQNKYRLDLAWFAKEFDAIYHRTREDLR